MLSVRSRRLAGTGAVSLALSLLLTAPAQSQTPDTSGPPRPAPATGPLVAFASDARVRQKLDAAGDYIKAQAWDEAVRILQNLLDGGEDQFLTHGEAAAPDRPVSHVRSVRAEANRLLAALPGRGRESYNSVHGPKARALLKQAIDAEDWQLLTLVVQRYLYTDAGAEAVERLGVRYLDRGERSLAARCFVHLLGRSDAGRLTPLTLYRAAVACRLAGDEVHAEQAWKSLNARAPDGVAIGGQVCELDRLRAAWNRLSAEQPARGNWPLYRAGAARSNQGDGDLPLLEPLWKVSTVLGKQATAWIEAGRKAQERANRPVLPGYYPIAVTGRVVYRSQGGVHAVDPASGREQWQRPSPLSLDAIAAESGKRLTVHNTWLAQPTYGGDALHFVLENSALGRLSSDGARVYAVEDLAVPPPPEVVQPAQFGLPPPGGPRDLVQALAGNRLCALDLATGERVWEQGGRGDFQGHFFLGAPLPVAGRLYALAERDGEIRLMCLDPAAGTVAWNQRLGITSSRVALDPGRRLRGVQMTCADGLLICPTDAGAVFAFDLFTRSLAWAHVYPSKMRQQDTGVFFSVGEFSMSWRESAPAIADGKVVVAPSDSDQVYCVRLRDGKPLWQANRSGYSYLAGVLGERVLLVGLTHARTLLLRDGKEDWARHIGTASGQGAASGTVYYLPLKSSSESGGPGVAALDMESGRMLSFAQSRNGEVPGNLIFFQGRVISQTVDTLTAYPQLRARLKHVEELLAAEPRNRGGLMERGTLRLDRGDVPGALADLRAAVAASAPGEARVETQTRLHEALKQALRHDFAANERYLAEFEASCRIPGAAGPTAEERRRDVNYLLVLARGREAQGRVAEALTAYARLYAGADRVPGTWNGADVGWLPGGTPRGRAAVWIHGRVTALLASRADHAAIAREVDRLWSEVRGISDPEALPRFIALFGETVPIGLQARLAFAERLAAQAGSAPFLQAELHLLALQRQREVPEIAARAREVLARLLTERGQVEDALWYYRQLAEEFAATPIRDGKTGADFLKELALDPRFLPFLDDPWAGRKYRTAERRGLFPAPGSLIGMDPEGESPPCLRRLRLALDTYGSRLRLFDRNTGVELWSHAIALGNLRQGLRTVPPRACIPYRAEGHLAVIALGPVACGIDLLERRLLWMKDLADGPAPAVQQVGFESLDHPRIVFQDGSVQRLGGAGPIRPAAVCVMLRGKLAALDPLRGDPLWTAAVRDSTADLFADDSHVYLVEGLAQGTGTVQQAFGLQSGIPRAITARRLQPPDGLQTVGRNVLFCHTYPNHDGRLALYDPLTGKEIWSQPVAAGTVAARSEVAHLTATVARDGSTHVYNLRRRVESFKAQVEPDHVRDLQDVRLFQDRWHTYLLLNRHLRGRDGLAGPPEPNAVGGLRCLPAHGYLYAFHRGTGSLHWRGEIKGQQLLLERLEDCPLLLFCAVIQRANPRATGPVLTVTSLDKHTGKTSWSPQDFTPAASPVHRIEIDPATGTIDVVSRSWRLRHVAVE
jgi:outer membrane protein assembly factor BamB/tetratricopeptide (TPR) repeat protein